MMEKIKELGDVLQRKAVEFMKRNWPHYVFFVVIVLAYTLFATGCATPDKAFIKTNYEASQKFGNDLIKYIQNDADLDDEHKEMRITPVKSWQGVSKKAYEVHYEGSGK